MRRHRLMLLLGCLVLSFLWGCSGVTPSVSAPSGPFFLPTSHDGPRLAALTHELDGKAWQCLDAAKCEQVYFSRALVRLFDNREAARAAFRHVIEYHPASPLANSSTLWLRLMDTEERAVASNDADFGAVTELMAMFVREWMDRQLSEPTNAALSPSSIHEQPIEQSRFVQALHKQVRDRDRQIVILRGQLEALKLIDEDHQDKARKVKPPASLKAAERYSP
jgi:hypothetical protein